jgi:hypothetical protein
LFLHSAIERLHGLGWSDTDIINPAFHGADMAWLGIMFKAFHLDRD